jgi:8-oxo-dGTP pyrophosphatase MutT (NUDIX family)
MHRRPLLQLLAAYRPFDDADDAAARRIAAFVDANPDCFQRSLEQGHVTGSALVVDATRRRVLLTHHRKLDRWLQLGGHCDGDVDVLGVAVREALEESGLSQVRPLSGAIFDCDVHAIPARAEEPEHFHYDVRFLLEADATEPLVISSESRDLAWVDVERVGDLESDDSLLRMVRKLEALP